MKRASTAFFIVLVLFLGSVFQSPSVARAQTEDKSYLIKMAVTYSNPNSGTQTWNFTEDDRTISLFMNTTWQTVQLINSSVTIETRKNDTDGNHIAVLQFPVTSLSHGQNISFSATYRVISKPRFLPSIREEESGVVESIPKDLIDKYTQGEGPWLISNSTLRSVALSVAGTETNVLTIIRKLVVWIHSNIYYPPLSKPHEFPLYPNETYVSENPLLNEGDCDDQAILLITLSRILGIPAFLQIGAIYLPNSPSDLSTYWEGHVQELAKRIGWHGWATVYVPPWGWLPVDLTYAQGAIDDPLKAITNAAVASQGVIQYMNVTKSDYVASSRQVRDFLVTNDFRVYMEDEMIEESSQNPSGEGLREWLMGGLIVTVIILAASSVLISRRLRKRLPNLSSDVNKP